MPNKSNYLDIPYGRILSTAEVAGIFAVDKATITRWVKSGAMETCYVMDSGTLLFDYLYISDLRDRMEANGDYPFVNL